MFDSLLDIQNIFEVKEYRKVVGMICPAQVSAFLDLLSIKNYFFTGVKPVMVDLCPNSTGEKNFS